MEKGIAPSELIKEKGITLLEILAVLVIIALVFVALSRNLGFGSDKAKTTDVQQATKSYQVAFEGSLNEHSGVPTDSTNQPDMNALNRYLSADYKIQSPVNGNGVQTSKLKDPWNTPYRIQAKVLSARQSLFIVRSAGADRKSTSTTDLFDTTQATTDKDDIMFISYYKDGATKSCTEGFEKDLGSVSYISVQSNTPKAYRNIIGSGGGTPLYDERTYPNYSVKLAQFKYVYEIYYRCAEYGDSHLSVVFSDVPLDLAVRPNGFEYLMELYDRNGNSFDTLNQSGVLSTDIEEIGSGYAIREGSPSGAVQTLVNGCQ